MRFFALEHCGTQQQEITWFRSYRFNRKQFRRLNGISSKLEKIDVGVSQGSCLGSLLFPIYINDLPHAVQNSVISMYADDKSQCYQASDMKLSTMISYNWKLSFKVINTR